MAMFGWGGNGIETIGSFLIKNSSGCGACNDIYLVVKENTKNKIEQWEQQLLARQAGEAVGIERIKMAYATLSNVKGE